MVSADAPAGERRSVALTCERLSFAGGRGLCLHLQRGVFNSYTALLLDRNLKQGASIKLEGLPSRTRASADGRVGAVTVFVLGDDYAAAFSTRTIIVDLASGDEIGELEQFSTWRDGARFKEVDFNFWGVTFAKDGNTFYAALRTGGKTFLVRGELGAPKADRDARERRVPGDLARQPAARLQEARRPEPRLLAPARPRSADERRAHRRRGNALHRRSGRVARRSPRCSTPIPRRTTAMADVWVAPIDGADASRIFLPQAESPVVVR